MLPEVYAPENRIRNLLLRVNNQKANKTVVRNAQTRSDCKMRL